ncbi:MAG TPA: serine protease [Thermoanaerobaculia bacterium]|nr:serine protease [Thermoanaerobaculia bacterium]
MSTHRISSALVLAVLAAAPPAGAQSVGPAEAPAAAVAPAVAPPLRLAEGRSAAPLIALRSARDGAPDQLEALAEWNRSGQLPVRVGFARPLPLVRKVELTAARLENEAINALAGGYVAPSLRGDLVWSTHVGVAGAHRLRLHLADTALPPGTRFWVWGLGEEPQSFGLELMGEGGDLWTPSVGGESIFLEVEVPRAALISDVGKAARFTLREVSQSFRLDAEGQPLENAPSALDLSCLDDATCTGAGVLGFIAQYRRAVAYLQFIDDGTEFLCSGALVNDTVAATFVPYLLTANHCFDTQASASTLEAFWDFKTNTCDGPAPGLGGLPRSNGATLLATSANSDFTFLRLNSAPGTRVFLGWNAEASAVPNNTQLFRISHPLGESQGFSRSTVKTSGVPVCAGAPRPRFLYSQLTDGATFGGSSGAPVILASGQIVGQLTGGCGDDPEEGCDYTNSEYDGAFSATFPAISAFLTPAATVCTPNRTTLCLSAGRFQVQATWQPPGGAATPARAVGLTPDSGYLTFSDPDNVEMVVKLVNACGLNSRYWVFAAGLTNVRVVTTVTDTSTGTVKTYTNPQGTAFAPLQDTNAFATCP